MRNEGRSIRKNQIPSFIHRIFWWKATGSLSGLISMLFPLYSGGCLVNGPDPQLSITRIVSDGTPPAQSDLVCPFTDGWVGGCGSGKK